MYYLFIMRRFVYIGKNHWFTAFLDSKIHTRLAIVTANELGLAFQPRNLPKIFCPDPSTFYLVIVVTDKQTNKQTDRQTDRQTYAGDSIIPRESFRGDNNQNTLSMLQQAKVRNKFNTVKICMSVNVRLILLV